MSAAEQIEAANADLLLIAQALCHADGSDLHAPCRCEGEAVRCCALDVYGDQARAVLADLERAGRLRGGPIPFTRETIAGFFDEHARRRGWPVGEDELLARRGTE